MFCTSNTDLFDLYAWYGTSLEVSTGLQDHFVQVFPEFFCSLVEFLVGSESSHGFVDICWRPYKSQSDDLGKKQPWYLAVPC